MRALRGTILHFRDDPHAQGATAVESFEDGALLIGDDGRIAALGDASIIPPGTPVERFDDAVIMPGLIDTHIHFPQTQVIGSYGAQLMDWLERYTFVEEQRYADPALCAAQASFFVDELLRNGTTTAVAYGSVHPQSVDALLAEGQRRGMRLIAGKSMMDRNAPPGLRDTAQASYDDSKALIARWHGRERIGYAITCRFAVTSSVAQMRLIGQLAAEHPDCWVQTHMSESHAEIAAVRRLFPEAASYAAVYDSFGHLGPRTLLGHCIHLDDSEIATLARTAAVACFCPTSNTFLGSGLFDLARLRAAGVRIALATDVGGGTSYSMLATAAEGYKVQQLAGTNWPVFEALYAMTLGNARALGLEDEIGSLQPGTIADITVLDLVPTAAIAHRMARLADGRLEEKLFALMTMADERAVKAVYVAGRPAAVSMAGPMAGPMAGEGLHARRR